MRKLSRNEELLSPQEFAERLHVHPATITRWVREGTLPAVRIRNIIRIRATDLERLLGGLPPSAFPNDEQSAEKSDYQALG